MNVDDILHVIQEQTHAVVTGCIFDVIRTFDDGLEIETKVDIDSLDQVKHVLSDVRQLGILKMEHRSEQHQLFVDADKGSVCYIQVKGLPDVWIKTKSKSAVIHTPVLRLPFVMRNGLKLKQLDAGYVEMLTRKPILRHVENFSKECFNIFFAYQDFLFSLSFSLASNPAGFEHTQMEFEYEGHQSAHDAPSFEDVLSVLEELFSERMPYLIDQLNARTKCDILLERNRLGRLILSNDPLDPLREE